MAKAPKVPKTENHIKAKLKEVLDELGAFHYPASAGAYGVSGIPDRIACFRGRFVGIEAKRPGRRNEANEGLSAHQALKGKEIREAGGLFFKVDTYESIEQMRAVLLTL